jgi:integrase
MVDFGPSARPTAAACNNKSTSEAYISRVFRKLKNGTVVSRLQIRLPKRLQPPNIRYRKRSGYFEDTPDGLAEAVRERDRQLRGLEQARHEAAIRGRADYAITVREAVTEWRETPAAKALKTLREREQMLKRDLLAYPAIAGMPARLFQKRELRAVLGKAAERGLGRSSLSNIKQAIRQVFEMLEEREQIEAVDWMGKVKLPSSRVETRDRAILTDEEFIQYVTSSIALVDKVMACTSRTFGGMRTSDLHAWNWSHIDTVNWVDAHCPRPKTERHGVDNRKVELTDIHVRFLKEYWLLKGKPAAGAVFGLERPGKKSAKKGDKKASRGISYAKRLRRNLAKAGITRRELFEPTDFTLPVDFHSFRRAFCTALATSGVNEQNAMALAGHRQSSTHKRYVKMAKRLSMPASAVPSIPQANATPPSSK